MHGAGNVYVTDSSNNRVLTWAAGSPTSTALPFTGLRTARGVAVQSDGTGYVTDTGTDKLVKLLPG